jgi:hypothetical protein
LNHGCKTPMVTRTGHCQWCYDHEFTEAFMGCNGCGKTISFHPDGKCAECMVTVPRPAAYCDKCGVGMLVPATDLRIVCDLCDRMERMERNGVPVEPKTDPLAPVEPNLRCTKCNKDLGVKAMYFGFPQECDDCYRLAPKPSTAWAGAFGFGASPTAAPSSSPVAVPAFSFPAVVEAPKPVFSLPMDGPSGTPASVAPSTSWPAFSKPTNSVWGIPSPKRAECKECTDPVFGRPAVCPHTPTTPK